MDRGRLRRPRLGAGDLQGRGRSGAVGASCGARTIPQWQDAQIAAYVDAPALPLRSTGATITTTLPYNAQFTPWFDIEAPAGLAITVRTDHYCGGGNGQDF